MPDTTTTTADPTTATATATASPWYAAFNDAEFTGTLQTRGLDKKDAAEAARNFYQAHREASQTISRISGTSDRDRILITPKPDATDTEKNAFYEKLGRPAKADDYDFKDIKFPDGSELDDGFTAMLRAAAFKANATKEQAATMARDLVSFLAKADEMETAEATTKLDTEKAELKKNWGANFEANMFIARQGAAKLGITPEAVQAMEKQVGYKAVLEGFLKAGQAFGEDKFIANRAPNTGGVMTREQATARLAELKLDKAWNKRFFDGDRQARAEFDALTAMMAGQQAA